MYTIKLFKSIVFLFCFAGLLTSVSSCTQVNQSEVSSDKGFGGGH